MLSTSSSLPLLAIINPRLQSGLSAIAELLVLVVSIIIIQKLYKIPAAPKLTKKSYFMGVHCTHALRMCTYNLPSKLCPTKLLLAQEQKGSLPHEGIPGHLRLLMEYPHGHLRILPITSPENIRSISPHFTTSKPAHPHFT